MSEPLQSGIAGVKRGIMDHVQVNTKITTTELAQGVQIDTEHSVNGASHLHLRKVMDVEDQLFRKRLIELGWTPPLEGWDIKRHPDETVSISAPQGVKVHVIHLAHAILKARGQ